MDLEKITEIVKDKLSSHRFEHTMAVCKLSKELARRYGVNEDYAALAALLHDYTKEESIEIQLKKIKESGIILDTASDKYVYLYHGLTAYLFAKNELHIQNEDILNAIRYHTCGKANMSMLEKIIYVADACSYDRMYPEVETMRKLSFEDIDECMVQLIHCNRKSLSPDATLWFNAMFLSRGKQNEERY